MPPELQRPLPPFDPGATPGSSAGYVPQARILPADRTPAPEAVREDVLAVYVRDRGAWRPTVLTGWARLPDGTWAARLQLAVGAEPVWVAADGHTVQPVQVVDALPGR